MRSYQKKILSAYKCQCVLSPFSSKNRKQKQQQQQQQHNGEYIYRIKRRFKYVMRRKKVCAVRVNLRIYFVNV